MAATTSPADARAKNFVDRAIEAISRALSFGFALSIVVTIYDVICDVVFKAPTVWVYDVVTTAIAVAFLIGGSYSLMRREHIRISAVFDRFSQKTKLRCEIASSILALVYLGAFIWFAFNMAWLSVTDWEVGGSVWAQPTPVVVKIAMVLGAALMIVQMLSNILGDVKSLRTRH